MLKKLAAVVALTSSFALASFAAAPAQDNASNYPGGTWNGTTNGGSGFGPWVFTTTGAGGSYIGATGDGNQNPSFGIFAGGANSGDASSVDRTFANGPLLAGETFSLTLGATGVNATGTPGVVGLNLLSNGSPVFTFKFTGGGTVWQLNDGGMDFGTSINFSASTQINFSFTYNGGNSYNVLITEAGSSDFVGNGFNANSTISNINGFRFFSNAQGAGENLGFNNLAVVPEPSSLALLAGPAILGAWFVARRRRS